MAIFFWILLFAFAAFCGYVQGNYNEKHQNKDEIRRKKETKDFFNRIRSEARRKYPGIGKYSKRKEYIEKRLRE